MRDSAVVVASYLMIGLTEEDIHYIKKDLERYGTMFVEEDSDTSVYWVEIISDTLYPCIALKVDAIVWERFARSHDMVEFSVMMAQNNIMGELH